VEQFEADLKKYTGAEYVVATSSGTASLHLACMAAGIRKGDQVITTPLTFVATSNSILYCGGKPVFVDIDPGTYNLSCERLEESLERDGSVRAVIPVHFGGLPCDMESIRRIARECGLLVIEDAAHAMGAEYFLHGNTSSTFKVGNPQFSDMVCLSFNAVKNMTTGWGGAVCTNNKDYYEKLIRFRCHGVHRGEPQDFEMRDPWFNDMIELGYNYQLTGFQCALGSSQIRRIDEFIRRRREIAGIYDEEFSRLWEIRTPSTDHSRFHARHLYVIRLRLESLRSSRKGLFEALRKENIGVNVHYPPVYFHSVYRALGYEKGLCPEAEAYYEEAITLPLFPKMTDRDVRDVIRAVKKVLTYYTR
jgi:perosamine synthetase